MRLLTSFLTEMDGLELAQGVLVLGATNRPQGIDSALLRWVHVWVRCPCSLGMDGLELAQGVLVLGATNRLQAIDAALLRWVGGRGAIKWRGWLAAGRAHGRGFETSRTMVWGWAVWNLSRRVVCYFCCSPPGGCCRCWQ